MEQTLRRLRSYKKTLIALGLVLLLVIGGAVGFYYYTLHTHARQISDMLYLLSQLELEEAKELDDAPPPAPAPAPAREDAASDAGAGTKEPPPAPGKSSPAPQGQVEIKPAPDPAPPKLQSQQEGEKPLPPPLPPAIQEKVQQNARLIRRVDLKDQLYAMQIVKQFSTQELQTMYSLFQEGGASRARLLELLQNKLSAEEFRKTRDIALKYRDLLS